MLQLLLSDGKVWAGLFSLLTLLMGLVSFVTKGAFKFPAEWSMIFLGIIGVFGVTKTGGAVAKHYVNSRFNSPLGSPPLETPPEADAEGR
jgi:hypothetical protein